MPSPASAGRTPRIGRRPLTSHGQLEQVALELFATRGFERTTVDDIAAAAGIGRRTFFRYYTSKNDIPWGNFDHELQRMRAWLARCPPDTPMMEALREAIVRFNHLDAAQLPWHRRRMTLILNVPALQAHSTLRYAAWRNVVAETVARRLNQRVDDMVPQLIAHASLGVAVAAYEQWLRDEGTILDDLLSQAMHELANGFQGHEPTPPAV